MSPLLDRLLPRPQMLPWAAHLPRRADRWAASRLPSRRELALLELALASGLADPHDDAPAAPAGSAEAAAAVHSLGHEDRPGCGWYESSQVLREGLAVTEWAADGAADAAADGSAGDALVDTASGLPFGPHVWCNGAAQRAQQAPAAR